MKENKDKQIESVKLQNTAQIEKDENLNKSSAKPQKNPENNQKYSEQARKNTEKNQKTQKMQSNAQDKHLKENKSQSPNKKSKKYVGAVIGLAITAGVLGAGVIGLGVAYGVSMDEAQGYSMQLENIYKKNYYELVDSVNNADMKISKLLASDDSNYQAKLLSEISEEARDMQLNIAALPLTGEDILQSVRFINQMSGYTQTLEKKLVQGGTIEEKDLETLRDMHDSLTEMKRYLNRMSLRMADGYNILRASENMNGDVDEFTMDFAQIKADDSDYPTMIYDGPFSDSVVNAKIKGLSGKEISKEEAYTKIDKLFKNISNLKYEGQSDGRFKTYNYVLTNSDNQNIYVQMTKIGGNVLTISGNVESDIKNIDFDAAKKIALDFVKANGIEKAEVVWSQELHDQAYFNIAPTQSGIVLYPDLVKVKVDMEHGDVIGYDAITYFTNHTARNLTAGGVGIDLARESVDKSFEIKNQRLVLAPLEYNREVLCYEFEAARDGATYYIYLNASTGQEENILKVVETDDGSKLM